MLLRLRGLRSQTSSESFDTSPPDMLVSAQAADCNRRKHQNRSDFCILTLRTSIKQETVLHPASRRLQTGQPSFEEGALQFAVS